MGGLLNSGVTQGNVQIYSDAKAMSYRGKKNLSPRSWDRVPSALIYALLDLKTKVYFALTMPNQWESQRTGAITNQPGFSLLRAP